MSANVESMIRNAIQSYRAGDKATARQLLEQATELDQMSEKAWMWLSAVVDSEEDRRICLENVLFINPDNQDAQKGLQLLTGAPSAPSSPAPTPTSDQPVIEPPTATSSASATYNPANEISSDEYDDWIGGLNLGSGEDEPTPVASSPAPADDAPGFDETLLQDMFGVDDAGLSLDDLIDDGYEYASAPAFDDEARVPASALMDDEPHLDEGPFSAGNIEGDAGFDDLFDSAFNDLQGEPDPEPASASVAATPLTPPPSSTRQSPVERGARATRSQSSAEPDDPGVYFQAIPREIRATQLPGTDAPAPLVPILLFIVLLLLNIGAVVVLVMG